MLSIGAVASSGAASAYFNRDDYYARDASSPSVWMGRGAAELGLEGPVGKAEFQGVLEGRIPGSEARLGRLQDGDWRHQPGWDLTFSAPKSVSIMAEVAGDERLAQAHDEAVRATVEKIERELAGTRVTSGDRTEIAPTGNLVVAAFRHDLSRNQDPQLHTHAVIVNMTKSEEGWRSLVSKPFYDNSKALGVHYQQELALRVRALGYEIETRPNGTFEIRGVDRETQETFSTRRAQIEAKLQAMGRGGEAASAKDAAQAALATRRKKGEIDRETARGIWRGAVPAETRSALDALRDGALARGLEAEKEVSPERRADAAADVVRKAVATLAERDAAFSKERVVELANRLAVGRTSERDVDAALGRLIEQGDLVGRQVVEADRRARVDVEKAGFATERMRGIERDLLAREAEGRGATRRLAGPRRAAAAIARAEARSAEAGHAWTDDQRKAAAGLLFSRNRVHAVQGFAGTAKTTTVLATYAAEAAARARDVRAFAPTASAAETLGAALKLEGKTVDRHLIEVRLGRSPVVQSRWGRAEQVWIVDEASLLSTEKLRDLLVAAEKQEARVVLVGDVRQLGSVEAGAGFRQLQEAGMATERLERIVRQSDAELRTAVERAAVGDAAGAMRAFSVERGNLLAEPDAKARYDRIAEAWLARGAAGRAGTIVVEPSREGRDAVNARIRAGLVAEGTLGPEAVPAERLSSKGLTLAEKRQAMNYDPGDRVRFARSYDFDGVKVEKTDYLTVLSISQSENRVALKTPSGGRIDWRPAVKGAAKAEVFEATESELRAGDRVAWTRNDPSLGLRNGLRGEVREVDPATRTATIAFESGASKVIALARDEQRHWRHDYAQTAYAAQGRTSDRVIVHAESHRINLVNQAAFYVAISRAKADGLIVTDDEAKLRAALAGRAGVKETALEPEPAQARSEREGWTLSLADRLREGAGEIWRGATRRRFLDGQAAERARQAVEARLGRSAEAPTRGPARDGPDRDRQQAKETQRHPERAQAPEPAREDAAKEGARDRRESLDGVREAAERRRLARERSQSPTREGGGFER